MFRVSMSQDVFGIYSPFKGEGNAAPSSTLAWKNPMDGGAWWAAVHGVTKSRT